MKTYRVEKRISSTGGLQLDGLPFREGELVEVIILSRENRSLQPGQLPIKGKVIEYINPTELVAQHDWDALR